jgi:hypothetical protein
VALTPASFYVNRFAFELSGGGEPESVGAAERLGSAGSTSG